MKLTFFTNYLNHHQLPFCLEMRRLLGADFCFVATTPFNQSRLQHGYQDMNKQYDFVLRSYEDANQEQMAMVLAKESDVILFGGAPEKFLYHRMRTNPKGLTIRYSERLYKENAGRIRYQDPMFWWTWGINHLLRRKNYYLLAASAYTPYDYVRSGFYRERILKWGYFPAQSQCSLEALKEKKGEVLRLIWVGRMIDWKHPEMAIEVARMLRDENVSFELVMVGTGPLEEQIRQQIMQCGLQAEVTCLGSLPTQQVREEMEKSHIHLFTSDYNEGWGAVLNESMASACVPVCTISVGAAPFLVRHEENGYLCNANDAVQMCRWVKALSQDRIQLETMQKAAYRQIQEQWNPTAAAERLLAFCDGWLHDETVSVPEAGPCSRAAFVAQEDMYRYYVEGKKNGTFC